MSIVIVLRKFKVIVTKLIYIYNFNKYVFAIHYTNLQISLMLIDRKDSIQMTNMDESENKKNESTWSKMKGYARDTTSRVSD